MRTSREGEVSIAASDATGTPFQVYRHYYERQTFATLVIMASIIGIVGNTFVIATVFMSRMLRTVTNVFVVNFSFSDILSCMSLPWQAVAVLSEGGWPLPQACWLCVVTSASTILSTECSVTNLALIAIKRWVGITKPTATTRRIYTRRNIAFSWAFPLAVLTPSLAGFGELGYEPHYGTCFWVKVNPFSIVQNIIVAVWGFPVQVTVIAVCYASIFVTTNLVYIGLAFVICIAPFFFFSMILLGYDWSIRMTPYAGAIVYCNSCVNPIIYATSHPDFKEVFRYMIRDKRKNIPQSRAQARL